MPAAPVAAPVPTMPAAPVAVTYTGQDFMVKVSQAMQLRDANGQPIIDATYLAKLTVEIATAFNVTLNVITDILNNPDMVNYAIGCLQRDGKWTV
jgi:hypothetical protein